MTDETVKLQTRLIHRRLTNVIVDGTTYRVDDQCCIDVPIPEHVADLLSAGNEWSADVKPIRPMPARAGVAGGSASGGTQKGGGHAMRGALEFLHLLEADDTVKRRFHALKVFSAVQALARRMGFNFSEAELATAMKEVRPAPAKAVVANPLSGPADADESADEKPKRTPARAKGEKLQVSVIEDANANPGPKLPPYALSGKFPKEEPLPEEDGTVDWPEPTGKMHLNYLRRMAESHEVVYAASDDPETLAGKILEKMTG